MTSGDTEITLFDVCLIISKSVRRWLQLAAACFMWFVSKAVYDWLVWNGPSVVRAGVVGWGWGWCVWGGA